MKTEESNLTEESNDKCDVVANLDNNLVTVIIYRTDDVFDWLSLADLAALNLTCKKLRELTNDYFLRKYPMKFMKCAQLYDTKEVTFRSKEKSVHHFWPNIRSLVLMPSTTSLQFLNAQLNKNLVSISFYDGEISANQPQTIAHLVKNADIIEIQYGRLDAEFYESLLKYCVHMKQLVIKYGFSECENEGIEYQWLLKTYPTLQYFHWSLSELPPHLEIFFQQNPSIRSFYSGVYPAMSTIEFFETTGICIDELHLELILELHEFEPEGMATIRSNLNTLYRRQQFQMLMLQFIFCSQLLDNEWAKLEYLNGAYVDFPNQPGATKALSSLVHLKVLILGINTKLASAKANKLAIKLVNLEEIYVQTSTIHAITPFLRNATKLRKIYVYRLSLQGKFNTKGSKNHISSLNRERMLLENPCKTTVYLPDEAYVRVKWESNTLNHSLIEIKRAESHTSLHPFAMTMLRRDICEMYEKF